MHACARMASSSGVSFETTSDGKPQPQPFGGSGAIDAQPNPLPVFEALGDSDAPRPRPFGGSATATVWRDPPRDFGFGDPAFDAWMINLAELLQRKDIPATHAAWTTLFIRIPQGDEAALNYLFRGVMHTRLPAIGFIIFHDRVDVLRSAALQARVGGTYNLLHTKLRLWRSDTGDVVRERLLQFAIERNAVQCATYLHGLGAPITSDEVETALRNLTVYTSFPAQQNTDAMRAFVGRLVANELATLRKAAALAAPRGPPAFANRPPLGRPIALVPPVGMPYTGPDGTQHVVRDGPPPLVPADRK